MMLNAIRASIPALMDEVRKRRASAAVDGTRERFGDIDSADYFKAPESPKFSWPASAIERMADNPGTERNRILDGLAEVGCLFEETKEDVEKVLTYVQRYMTLERIAG